jgi:hypothetical protein
MDLIADADWQTEIKTDQLQILSAQGSPNNSELPVILLELRLNEVIDL